MIKQASTVALVLSLFACGSAGVADANGAAEDDPLSPSTGTTSANGASSPGPEPGAGPGSPSGSGTGTGPVAPGAEQGGAAAPGAIVGGGGAPPPSNVAITKTDWMAQTPGLGKKALNAISIPGTHDSGTYGIISVYNRPVNDAFAPDDGANGFVRLGEFGGVADKWAKSQNKTVRQQLDGGMRMIDLRPCVERSGTLRVCHGLYGPKIEEILSDVAAFADAHPKEFLLLDMSSFAGMSEIHHTVLTTMIFEKLAAHLLNYGAGDVTPTSTLDKIWATGKSIAVIYEDDAHRNPFFLPKSKTTGSWQGNVWKRQPKHDVLASKVYDSPNDTFFFFSGTATPDTDLIEYSLDPLGNYPTSLEKLAAQTNPVVLGWAQNEWGGKALNILTVDFFQDSCVFELTQAKNGVPQTFAGCTIGQDTNWGKWAVGPYGRGAGTPLTCAPGEQYLNGLCYTPCQAGYSAPLLFPYLCTASCPAGWRDDGLTCFHDLETRSADTSSCSLADKCSVFTHCSKCPAGWTNTGCFCSIGPKAIDKDRYNRGVGRPISSCAAGTEKSGLLCYTPCKPGYNGVGPLCVPQ